MSVAGVVFCDDARAASVFDQLKADVAAKRAGDPVIARDQGSADEFVGGFTIVLRIEPTRLSVDLEKSGDAVLGEEEPPALGGDLSRKCDICLKSRTTAPASARSWA